MHNRAGIGNVSVQFCAFTPLNFPQPSYSSLFLLRLERVHPLLTEASSFQGSLSVSRQAAGWVIMLGGESLAVGLPYSYSKLSILEAVHTGVTETEEMSDMPSHR